VEHAQPRASRYARISPKYHIVVDPLHVADVPNTVAWLRDLEKVETPTTFVFPVQGAALFEKYGLFKGKTVRYMLLSEQRCGTGKVKGDLARPVSGVKCVSVGAILLAIYLGFQEIYLLGCDHDWLAHPTVELQDGADPREYTVRVADGAERETWWERAVAVWPAYSSYQEKTDRVIPVFVAEQV